ncbi:MAG: hypothetical protein HY717_08820, partial [Planctomycetes bacterium]|nr:hypothetical protein [Planctomycetota bacterium]
MAGKNTAAPPLDNPPAVSAEELHTILLKAFKVGNLARRKFIQALLAMDSSRLYLQLGFSSIAQYAEKHFGCQHTQTYDLLRVAAALRELP